MKTKLLFISLFLTSSMVLSQVVANQVDDFEDGTTQNWAIGDTATNQPTNVPDGGPNGAGDSYFSYTTTGNGGGAGSKMIIYTRDQQWSGNYASQSIVGIKFDVRATTADLSLRFGLNDESTVTGGNQIITINPVLVTAGSGWQSVTIPISPSAFNNFGVTTIAEVLSNVVETRILSNTSVSWLGQSGLRTMDIDNIRALTTLDVEDFNTQNEFAISPNPARSKLNIDLSNALDNVHVTVYDVLGKKVYSKALEAMTSSIDVSKWNAGVYLVRVSSDSKTLTKRFVKQ